MRTGLVIVSLAFTLMVLGIVRSAQPPTLPPSPLEGVSDPDYWRSLCQYVALGAQSTSYERQVCQEKVWRR